MRKPGNPDRKIMHDEIRDLRTKMRRGEHLFSPDLNLSGKQEGIIVVALKLLKKDGLENITLRKIATRMEVQAPAIYWHFKNKVNLIDYMAEAILEEEFGDKIQPDYTRKWDNWFRDTMLKLHHAMMRYPDGAKVVAGAHLFPARTLGDIYETSLDVLIHAGVKPKNAMNLVMTAVNYTFGYTIEAQSDNAESDEKDNVDYIRDAFPTIYKVMAATDNSYGDESFLAGLNLVIVGGKKR
jgi:TetR/AcrR family tetracycline transcriptional repressor